MLPAPVETPEGAIQVETAQRDPGLTGSKAPNLDRDFYPVTPPPELESDAQGLLVPSSEPVDADAAPLVAVIGVGYVGLHLAEVFSREYDTLGFDVSAKRLLEVKRSFDGNGRVTLTCSPQDLDRATHFLISVPTLLLPDKSVDTSYLRSALKTVAGHARPGSTVVIESSVAIGMTRELLGPLAKLRGYYAGMSPEVRFEQPRWYVKRTTR